MTSIVDDKDAIGHALAVLRGKGSSGRVFRMTARGSAAPVPKRPTEYAEQAGHRFADDVSLKCVACGLNYIEGIGEPCASASMPLLEHVIDPVTGGCVRCHATVEQFHDNEVDMVCRCAGEPVAERVRVASIFNGRVLYDAAKWPETIPITYSPGGGAAGGGGGNDKVIVTYDPAGAHGDRSASCAASRNPDGTLTVHNVTHGSGGNGR